MKELHGEQCRNQAALSRSLLAAATQTDQDTSGSDDECFWDDDDDDLSGDEPTVIIRLDRRPEEEEEEERTRWQNLRQRQATPVASATSTQVNFSAVPTESNAYFRQGSRQSVQEAVTMVEQYGQEYGSSEATASGSSVQMVPVLSYLCFPVVMYQPCTVETSSATDLPVESSQPYDATTATQDLSKENHWEVACTPATYYSPTLDSCNSVATSEEEWRKERSCAGQQLSQWTTEFTTDFSVTSPQLYNTSPLSEDRETGQEWDSKFQPLQEFALTSESYNQAVVISEPRGDDWEQGFPAQHSEATQTTFGASTSEWQGAKHWQRERTPAPTSASSAGINSYCGMAATEDTLRRARAATQQRRMADLESEEDWEQEIVPGQAGYVPQVPTIFQRMRHRSQRQRRRLYREQAANFRLQEEERSKANADGGPMEVGGHRPSDGSGPSGEGFVLPVPPVPVGACQGKPSTGLQGSQLNRAGRRTMADVVRSSPAPAPAQPPLASSSSSSHPAGPVAASYRAAAGDQVQATPEVGTWEVASFLQAAWTVAADTDGCVLYESKQYTR
ncbi:hypothetical protein MTO96_047868 [Rhipicephalus appendiculatus]